MTGEKSVDIYRLADYRAMDLAYEGYHTLSCEMAVERLKTIMTVERGIPR